MSVKRRKKVLSKFYDFYLTFGPNHFVDANTLSELKISKRDLELLLNQLVREELMLCVAKEPQNPAVAINPKKIKEVRAELDAWYNDTKFIISTIIGVAGWVVAFISLLSK